MSKENVLTSGKPEIRGLLELREIPVKDLEVISQGDKDEPKEGEFRAELGDVTMAFLNPKGAFCEQVVIQRGTPQEGGVEIRVHNAWVNIGKTYFGGSHITVFAAQQKISVWEIPQGGAVECNMTERTVGKLEGEDLAGILNSTFPLMSEETREEIEKAGDDPRFKWKLGEVALDSTEIKGYAGRIIPSRNEEGRMLLRRGHQVPAGEIIVESKEGGRLVLPVWIIKGGNRVFFVITTPEKDLRGRKTVVGIKTTPAGIEFQLADGEGSILFRPNGEIERRIRKEDEGEGKSADFVR